MVLQLLFAALENLFHSTSSLTRINCRPKGNDTTSKEYAIILII